VALVLGSRSDPPLPLHRWRVNGLLGELRSDELRFSARETAQVVAANGGELTPDDANALTERTEGWAAGVQLARWRCATTPTHPASCGRSPDPIATSPTTSPARCSKTGTLAGAPRRSRAR
jgi:ATP/maltotriose-dependent transcriptional regulator MalT